MLSNELFLNDIKVKFRKYKSLVYLSFDKISNKIKQDRYEIGIKLNLKLPGELEYF